MSHLEPLGFDARWSQLFAPHLPLGRSPARVARADRDRLHLVAAAGEPAWPARVSGRLRHEATTAAELPAVGDWVAATFPAARAGGEAVVHAVLPRRTCFARKVAGRTSDAQVAAANVDTVFLVAGLDGDFNLRRLERYLVATAQSGAAPVVVLNKADLLLARDPAAYAVRLAQAEDAVGAAAPVRAVSALAGDGLETLAPWLSAGRTVALLGSSGVGKSTLANALAGAARLAVAAVRAADDRGRHTTSHRELVALPGGAWLVDTPGMRELGLLGDDGNGGDAASALAAASFGDLEALARTCRFTDCTHRGEPGCAVARALEDGTLAEERWASWQKLAREMRAWEARHDRKAAAVEKAKWKAIHVAIRKRPAKGRW